MPFSLRFRLSLMMFLNYFVWGCWYVTLGTYLTANLKFTGTQAGAVFGTSALAAMISPVLVGLVADRYFPPARVMAILHLAGAILLYLVTRTTSFWPVYLLMLAYCLCFFPTIALTNAITLRTLTDAGRDFPLIRVFATIGWIAIGLIIGNLGIETTAVPFFLAAGVSVVIGLFCFTLPAASPSGGPQPATLRAALGLDAWVMLKERSYLVFAIGSVLACIPLTFYFSFTNAFLNEAGVRNAAGKMTIGQASEVGVMLLMPLIFRRATVRHILIIGLVAWSVRYLLLAFGNAGAGMWMFYAAILVHGVCYDFFFMTGQLYTDQVAPAHLRNAAQGLITFLTYGIGMFIGSLLSGRALDAFTTSVNGVITRNWFGFWTLSSAGSFVLVLLVLLFFRTNHRIEAVK